MSELPSLAEVLAAVPHRPPFHFIDEILEVDDEHIVAACRFPAGADFYRGHFPGHPITPGVLLLEAMAQAGVVAHGIYLMARSASGAGGRPLLPLFTEASIESRRAVAAEAVPSSSTAPPGGWGGSSLRCPAAECFVCTCAATAKRGSAISRRGAGTRSRRSRP